MLTETNATSETETETMHDAPEGGLEVITTERIDGVIAKPHAYTAIVDGEPVGVECDAKFLRRGGVANPGGAKFSSVVHNTPEQIGVKLMIELSETAGERAKNTETHAILSDSDALGLAAMLIADVAAARGRYTEDLAQLEAQLEAMRARMGR